MIKVIQICVLIILISNEFSAIAIANNLEKSKADKKEISQKNAAKNFKKIIIPGIWFLPETNWGAGFGFLGNWGDKTRPSRMTLGGGATLNSQFFFHSIFTIYHKPLLKWDKILKLNNPSDFQSQSRFFGSASFFKWRFQYYNIGNSNSINNFRKFDAIFPDIKIISSQEISPHLWLGLTLNYRYFKLLDTNISPPLNNIIIPNDEGHFLEPGFRIDFDSRNNDEAPTKGMWLSLNLFKTAPPSNYNTHGFKTDLRFFKLLNANEKKPIIFAAQWYNQFSFGDIPYFQLSEFGGRLFLRGYFQGRFRDNHIMLGRGEIRWVPFKRWGFNIFGGGGNVSDTINNFNIRNIKYAGGLGIRYIPFKNKTTRLALDVAKGEQLQFYLNVGEAF